MMKLKSFFFNLSIKNKINLAMLVIMMAVSAFIFLYFPRTQKAEVISTTRRAAEKTSKVLAYAFAVALYEENYEALSVGYDYVKGIDNIAYIIIYTDLNEVLSTYNPDSLALHLDRSGPKARAISSSEYIETIVPIIYGNKEFGHVVIGVSLHSMHEKIRGIYLVTAFIIMGLIVLSGFLTEVISRIIARPLAQIAAVSKDIAAGNLTKRVDVDQKDEVGQLAQSFNQMVSDLKANHEKLEAAQKEVVENAHKAGMADVATGVIHNIGNIVNTVHTSSNLITTVASNLSVNKLKKANELLRANIDDPFAFFRDGKKGPMLLQYYLLLEESLKSEQEQLLGHAQRIAEKINAMNDVIRLQQNYAAAGFYSERLDITELIEETLRLQEDSLGRNDIRIVRQYEKVPEIEVQKTKLAQILLNIIKNAKEAVSNVPEKNRMITIKVEKDREYLYVKFIDKGIGIRHENLSKIFNHGFTTKESGHGFGLHTCANQMTEMGAKIYADSEGEGNGATFVLQFPLKTADKESQAETLHSVVQREAGIET